MKTTTLTTLVAGAVAAVCVLNLAMTGVNGAEQSFQQRNDRMSGTPSNEMRTAGLFGLPIPQQWLGQPRSVQGPAYQQRPAYQQGSALANPSYRPTNACPNGNCGIVPTNRVPGYGKPPSANPWMTPRNTAVPYNTLPRTTANLDWEPVGSRNSYDNRHSGLNQNWNGQSAYGINQPFGTNSARGANCVNGRCQNCPNGQCQSCAYPNGQCNCANGQCNCPSGPCIHNNNNNAVYRPSDFPRREISAPVYRPVNQIRY